MLLPFQDPAFHSPLPRRRNRRRFTTKNFFAGGAATILLLLIVITFTIHDQGQNATTTTPSPRNTTTDCGIVTSTNSPILLQPGELPGYTGWARSDFTLAGFFRIVKTAHSPDRHTYSISIECRATQTDRCRRGGASFFARAYGPAVIPGVVSDFKNGSYRVDFFAKDGGSYNVEVVLTYSHVPRWASFPLGDEVSDEEPGYEGWLLPGFPLRVDICAGEDRGSGDALTDSEISRRWCHKNDLIWNADSTLTVVEKGRWKVVNKINTPSYYHRLQKNSPKPRAQALVSLKGYQERYNSIGIQMSYEPYNCRLFSTDDVVIASSRSKKELQQRHIWDQCLIDAGRRHDNAQKDKNDMIHVIFIGDSVMNRQKMAFDALFRNATSAIKTTLISTHGGISLTLPNVIENLKVISERQPRSKKFILFNTGLHDVAKLCSRGYAPFRTAHLNMTSAYDFSCGDVYRSHFETLVAFLEDYEAELKVFRTTTAGWPKYGNYGFAWPVTKRQTLPFASEFVHYFNVIASDVIRRRSKVKNEKSVDIVDAYWLSYSRPDDTEVSATQEIGKHLVHPGLEVMNVMGVQWMMLIMRTLCEETIDNWK